MRSKHGLFSTPEITSSDVPQRREFEVSFIVTFLSYWGQIINAILLTLMLLVVNLSNTYEKDLQNGWNPGTWVLIWEYSARAIQWVPTCQGLDGFQRSLRPCPLDESSLSIGSVDSWEGVLQECTFQKQRLNISHWQISHMPRFLWVVRDSKRQRAIREVVGVWFDTYSANGPSEPNARPNVFT